MRPGGRQRWFPQEPRLETDQHFWKLEKSSKEHLAIIVRLLESFIFLKDIKSKLSLRPKTPAHSRKVMVENKQLARAEGTSNPRQELLRRTRNRSKTLGTN